MMDCCIVDPCEDECEVWTETRRKARKAHNCIECSREIPPGAHYWEWTGIGSDRRPFRYRCCELCQSVIKDRFRCGFYIGMVWESLMDAEGGQCDCEDNCDCDALFGPPTHPINPKGQQKWQHDKSG